MNLGSNRNPNTKVLPAVVMIALVAVIVLGVGTGLAAKKKVAAIAAHVVTFEKVDKIFGVYPNEIDVGNGDVIKFTNESGVAVNLKVPDNLFVNDKDELISGTAGMITIENGKTQILNVYDNANTTKGDTVTFSLEVTFDPATEKVQARPRIIVQPPSS